MAVREVIQGIERLTSTYQLRAGPRARCCRRTRQPAAASRQLAATPALPPAGCLPARCCCYCFTSVSPLTFTSALCATRIPYTPSVDFSLPAPTASDLS